MPIRFRCVYCDKLLGIARRKAGAVVNCPHCSEKLIVPTPEPGSENEGTEEAKGTAEVKVLENTAGPQLFERSDFDHLLQPEPTFRSGEDEPVPSTAPQRPSGLPPVPMPYVPQPYAIQQPYAPVPLSASRQPPGFFVSSSKLTWLSVAAVVLLAAAFGLGLVVGRMMKS
jgi:DNA-directed RNA polymerase subunit RPC12/RpoP